MTPTTVRKRVRARRGEGDRLRDEIVDATERLLIRTGNADAVSIRAVADAVGVTPPAIYRHFEHKDDLILQVCERAFAHLNEHVLDAADVADPVDAVKAMGRAYVEFGLQHPEQYRILFMMPTPEWAQDMGERINTLSGFDGVVAAAQRCIDAGRFEATDAFTVACGLWMGVHGVTSLLISKPSFPWPDQEALIEHCLDGYCRGLTKG